MTDLISRADAIEAVHKYFADAIDDLQTVTDEDGDVIFKDTKLVNELLKHNKAISKELKALPSAELPKGDLISRADAIKQIKEEIQDFETNYMHGEDDENYGHDIGFVTGLHRAKTFIRSLPSADAVSREECDECKTDKEGVLLQQLAELQGDYETMKNAYEDALADAEWIPCSERLPSEERHYLCCNKGYLPYIAYYYGGQWYDFGREISRVDAWMPLPEPYKGGEEE